MNLINKYISTKLLALLVLTILFAIAIFDIQKSNREKEAYIEANKIHPEDYYRGVNILANYAYVFNYTDKKPLFRLHEYSPRPFASLTKLMSVALADEILGKDTVVVIPSKITLESESDYSLVLGAKWYTGDLSKFILLGSSNAAVEVLQNYADSILEEKKSQFNFIELMNKKAKEYGMTRTQFFNATGLDIDEKKVGAFGSAEDMVNLVGNLLQKYPELFSDTVKSEVTYYDLHNRNYVIKNTNLLLEEFSPILLSKTGFTDLSGGNLVIAYESHGKVIIICVLGSTLSGRFNDTLILKNITEKYLEDVAIKDKK